MLWYGTPGMEGFLLVFEQHIYKSIKSQIKWSVSNLESAGPLQAGHCSQRLHQCLKTLGSLSLGT